MWLVTCDRPIPSMCERSRSHHELRLPANTAHGTHNCALHSGVFCQWKAHLVWSAPVPSCAHCREATPRLKCLGFHGKRRKDTGEILGVHIFGLHAADLIHEASNAVATGQSVQDIKFNVHAHPTLSEVGHCRLSDFI